MGSSILKSVSGNTLTFDDGSTKSVASGASVTLNGSPAKLSDLKAGDNVSCSGDPATSVSATR